MLVILGICAVALCAVLVTVHNATPYDPAWEEKMLTQEELEELANELWEQKE